jgi:Mce-associated membrane protein
MLVRWPALLAAVTVLLGGLAVWSHRQAGALRDAPAAGNAALADAARTSEVKAAITDIVDTVFSYDHADTGKTERAARSLLVGKAVQQYDAMFGPIREQAQGQRLILTTSVTDSAVKTLRGDRARLLVFADQRGTRGSDGRGSYAAAMLAVDAVRRSGRWKISGIDPLTGPRR